MVLEDYNGIKVLRDDLLPGGTKSILMPSLIRDNKEYVYASPVYGGFQIALSHYCKQIGKKATIFTPKRKVKHDNTITCIKLGANVIEVPYGYLSVLEKRAKDYCFSTGAEKLVFGAKTKENINLIAERMLAVTKKLGYEPKEVWCAIGSGTLVEGILQGTTNTNVYGVQVGADYQNKHNRLTVLEYPKKFEFLSKHRCSFQSMPNYDLKALEFCEHYKKSDSVLFWNVY